MLLADAQDAALNFRESVGERLGKANEEAAARLMQEVLRAEAACTKYMEDRLEVCRTIRPEADRVLALLQNEKARAQSLVRTTSWLNS